jgi:hypothetical protein
MIGKTAFRGTSRGVPKGNAGLLETTLAPDPGPVRAGTPPASTALTVKFNLRPVKPKMSSDGRLSKKAQSLVTVGSALAGMGRIRSNEARATKTIIIRFIVYTSSRFVASILDEI